MIAATFGLSRLEEARRQLAVCDACRYCEGYCAVFPALERRGGGLLLAGDVAQLANLCHDCRACYQACPFTPPHEFAVDVPALFGAARLDSYERFAWPGRPGRWAFRHPSLAVVGTTAAGLALGLAVAAAGGGLLGRHTFYAVVPYLAMLVPALAVSAFVLVVLGAGLVRFWRATGGGLPGIGAWLVAAGEALGLRWLGGGGGGCYYPDPERPSGARRALHVLVVGGLALAFAATVAAALLQDVLGVPPPYPVLSAPVLLGTLGGAALIAGCTGLLVLAPAGGASRALESAFLAALLLAAVTGMLTLALRATPALGPALVLHLGALAGLYATAPYGKLVHGVYRFAALLRDATER